MLGRTLVGARDLPRLTADERERERLVEAAEGAPSRRVASNIERLREANSGGEPAIVTSLDSMCTKTLAIEICESTTLDELRELAIGAKKISTIWDNFVQMMQALQSNRHVDGDQDDDDDMEEDNDEDDDEDNDEDADDEDDENAADDGGGGCNLFRARARAAPGVGGSSDVGPVGPFLHAAWRRAGDCGKNSPSRPFLRRGRVGRASPATGSAAARASSALAARAARPRGAASGARGGAAARRSARSARPGRRARARRGS